jgi:hypothetical protein
MWIFSRRKRLERLYNDNLIRQLNLICSVLLDKISGGFKEVKEQLDALIAQVAATAAAQDAAVTALDGTAARIQAAVDAALAAAASKGDDPAVLQTIADEVAILKQHTAALAAATPAADAPAPAPTDQPA